MKKFLLTFILIFSLSFFCGCKEKDKVDAIDDFIYSGINITSSGEVCQTFAISVNSEEIESMSSSQAEGTQFKSNLIEIFANLRNQHLISCATTYLKNPKEEYKIGSGVKFTQVCYQQNNDVISFDIIFSSNASWNFYHSSTVQSVKKKNNFYLLKKNSSSSNFPFSVQDKNGVMVGEGYKQIYLSAARGLSFEEKLKQNYAPNYIYSYSTFSGKLKTNATYCIKDNLGQFNHIWIKNEENIKKNEKIIIYFYQINYGAWILIALILPCLGLFIYLIFFSKKNKIKK